MYRRVIEICTDWHKQLRKPRRSPKKHPVILNPDKHKIGTKRSKSKFHFHL